jgi:hypothetical protein
MNDTWLFDGATWRLDEGARPYERSNAGFARVGNRLVLHGGVTHGSEILVTNDTWEWNGSSWKDFGYNGPSRAGHGMAGLGDRVILFGGWLDDETWQWDGSAWSQLAVSGTRPPVRYETAMATLGDKIVMFGGRTTPEGQTRLADTWEWDGAAWKERKVTGPSPRSDHCMATVE